VYKVAAFSPLGVVQQYGSEKPHQHEDDDYMGPHAFCFLLASATGDRNGTGVTRAKMPRPGSRGLKTKFSTPLRTLIPQIKTSTTAKGWQADVLCGRCPAFYLLRLASKAASSRAARVLASLPLLAEALRDRAGAVECLQSWGVGTILDILKKTGMRRSVRIGAKGGTRTPTVLPARS
jgi:hypothetical protein